MASILDTAQPVSEVSNSVNMLLYGDSGVGKTVFAGSGRDHGKHDLIIDIESGTLSAARSKSQANVIPAYDYDTFVSIVEAVEEDPDRFEWVIVDSITKLQDIIWDKIMSEAVAKNPSRSPYKRELQEWGEAQSRLKDLVERLKNSDANVLFIALADSELDEDGNTVRVPAVHGSKGKVQAWVSAQMDVVAYIRVLSNDGGSFRAIHFNKTPEFYAKDRLRLYPGKGVKNLTLAKYTDKILSQSEPEEDNEEKDN